MSIKLNDTQLVLLSAASQRDDHGLVPPTGRKLTPGAEGGRQASRSGACEGDKGEGGSADLAARRGDGPLLYVQADGGRRKGDRGRRDSALPGRGGTARRPTGRRSRFAARTHFKPPAVDRLDGVAARNPMPPRSGTKIAEVIELLQRERWRNSRRACRYNGLADAYHARGAHRSCASAAMRSRLIGPTSFGDRSIGSNRWR